MKHFYFKPFPLRPALWSVIPTPASNPDVSAFEERIPVELQLYIFTLLEHQDRIRLATIHKDKLRFLDDPKIWELLYHRWQSYALPSTLELKKPNSDKTAFKQLYSSLSPLERKLIIAAFHGDSATLRRYTDDKSVRDHLLIIAVRCGDLQLLQTMEDYYGGIQHFKDIMRLGLVSYRIPTEKRQLLLDYFWSVAKSLAEISMNNTADNTLAIWATTLNQPKALAQILKENPESTHKPNRYGITPLMFAEYLEYTQCVKVIKAKGILTSSKPKKRNLNRSLTVASYNENTLSVLVLLTQGANPNYTYKISSPPFVVSGAVLFHSGIARILLELGADPSLKNELNETDLMGLARTGKLNIIRILLAYGADPYQKNGASKTALMMIKSNTSKKCKSISIISTGHIPKTQHNRSCAHIARST